MLPSAPVVMTIVFGGAGRMKCSVIQIATRRSSRNDPYVSARSRQETCEILKRGMKGFGTLAALAVGFPTRARTWDLRINSSTRQTQVVDYGPPSLAKNRSVTPKTLCFARF